MEIAGLPLHPLVVHAVVVLGPLAALLGLGYAVRPGWRWLLRWPLVGLAVVAAVAGVVAAGSGEDLLESRGLGQLEAVADHGELGESARSVLLAFAVVAGLGAWRLGGVSALASGRGARTRHGGAVDLLVVALLVAGAVGVLVVVALAGDSGARAVWG